MPPREYNPRSLLQWRGIQRPTQRDVTVMIPTVGRALLATCLEYILDSDVWPHEVLIINQGDEHDARMWIRSASSHGLNIRYIPLRAIGKSASLNAGFQTIHTRFVAIIDDDCLVERNWLDTMMKRLELTPEAIISGRVEADLEETSVSTITDDDEVIYRKPLLKTDVLYGGNMGIAMDSIHRIGGFDESEALRYAEDNDFGYRALRAGVPIVYAPEVSLVHVSWRDESQRASRYEAYARSQGGFYGKHIRQADLFMLVRFLRDQVRGPIRWLKGTVKANADDAASGKALTLNLVPGVIDGFLGR